LLLIVSIHARTRRATGSRLCVLPVRSRFQSTPAHGGRHARHKVIIALAVVSIHARTRRATSPFSKHWFHFAVSIHARTRRATDADIVINNTKRSFNPRPHTAGDTPECRRVNRRPRFNPRPHTAGDFSAARAGDCSSVSIHARTRRATMKEIAKLLGLAVSIHARTRRATLIRASL